MADPHTPEPKFANVTLAQQVYDHLRQHILDNAYLPAAPLPEEAVAATLNVSRVPVREALRRLAAEGLVTLTPRQGAVVSSLSRKQFLDAYRLRGALEALAIRLAIPNLTPKDLDRLGEIDAEMRAHAAGRDAEAFFTANAAFHSVFIDRAGNAYLRATYEPLMDQMRRYRAPSVDLRGGLERSIEEHEAILAAVRKGDAAEASRLITEHIAVPQRMLEDQENDDIPLREKRMATTGSNSAPQSTGGA